MALAVLRARPAERRYWFAWQLPPAASDVLMSHVRALAWALAGEEDRLEGGAGDETGVVERGPEARDFRIRQDALAASGCVAIDQLAWVGGQFLFLDRPREDRRDGREHLVGENWRLDAGHQC